MKFLILLLFLANRIVGEYTNNLEYEKCEKCESWKSLFDSTEFHIDENCCNSEGFICVNGKVTSIDITLKSGEIDMTKLPKDATLEKFSIKGDIYKGVFPIQLLNSNLYKILDLSYSNITEIPRDFEENDTIETIYLKNNTIKEFPYQFAKLKNLKELNLEYNDFNVTDKYREYCDFFNNSNIMNQIPDITLADEKSQITGLHYSCSNEDVMTYIEYYNSNNDSNDSNISGLLIFFGFLSLIAWLMQITLKCSSSPNENNDTFRNETRACRQESDILPSYNDIVNNNNNNNNNNSIINISENPPNYAEINNNDSSQNNQPRNNLPTYEETINRAVSSN